VQLVAQDTLSLSLTAQSRHLDPGTNSSLCFTLGSTCLLRLAACQYLHALVLYQGFPVPASTSTSPPLLREEHTTIPVLLPHCRRSLPTITNSHTSTMAPRSTWRIRHYPSPTPIHHSPTPPPQIPHWYRERLPTVPRVVIRAEQSIGKVLPSCAFMCALSPALGEASGVVGECRSSNAVRGDCRSRKEVTLPNYTHSPTSLSPFDATAGVLSPRRAARGGLYLGPMGRAQAGHCWSLERQRRLASCDHGRETMERTWKFNGIPEVVLLEAESFLQLEIQMVALLVRQESSTSMSRDRETGSGVRLSVLRLGGFGGRVRGGSRGESRLFRMQ
jgi:hypothetical protein